VPDSGRVINLIMDTKYTIDRIRKLKRHIRNVQDAAELLGERLIENGEVELGRRLIANSLMHDNSKFHGFEWDHLEDDLLNPLKVIAIQHHKQVNPHHPEYWSDIKNVPPVYLAEMVCDWKARSTEFGTDLRKWIKETAFKKFGFTTSTAVYKQIKQYVDLLLDDKFKQITPAGPNTAPVVTPPMEE
jgi:hypothetical protein